jgi:16S rRNA (adenine1518-N6/adenine1519-N6)-dimethyltransferase
VVIDDAAAFNQLVTAAFSQRRKTLRNALKNLLSDSQIASLDIDPQARAETLPLSAFAQLHRLAYSLQPTQ